MEKKQLVRKTISLKIDVFNMIEEKRKDTPFSTFINNFFERELKEIKN